MLEALWVGCRWPAVLLLAAAFSSREDASEFEIPVGRPDPSCRRWPEAGVALADLLLGGDDAEVHLAVEG